MLNMAQKEYIKDLYENEDLSLREIAKRTHHSFRTVQKYAYQEDWNENNLPNISKESYPVLGDYIPIIDKWLEEDRKAPRKQRHTVRRIYCRLRDEYGYEGSYSSVKKYVRKKKFVMRVKLNGYLPLEQPKGCGQVDFGEFVYQDSKGEKKKGYALIISFPYSNKGYMQAFPSQNQEALLEGMKNIFEHIGGVPVKLRFDNMTTAVAKIEQGEKRILTDSFQRFMMHYRFQAEFCNPASGNEKGNVENKVGYSRRNAFVPMPVITSFDEFNEQLWEWCENDAKRLHYKHKVPIRELWEEEKDVLLNLPEYPYQVFRYEVLSVNKYGFVTVETNKYGLSPSLAGEKVQAKIFVDRIEFFYDHKRIGQFIRSYSQNEEIYDWTQYVTELSQKPRAASNTRFFKQMPEIWQKYLIKSQGKERKDALQLLKEIVDDGNSSLCSEALLMAAENGRTDTDSIRQCYYMITRREFHPKPLKNVPIPLMLEYSPDLTAYDLLTGGNGDE